MNWDPFLATLCIFMLLIHVLTFISNAHESWQHWIPNNWKRQWIIKWVLWPSNEFPLLLIYHYSIDCFICICLIYIDCQTYQLIFSNMSYIWILNTLNTKQFRSQLIMKWILLPFTIFPFNIDLIPSIIVYSIIPTLMIHC